MEININEAMRDAKTIGYGDGQSAADTWLNTEVANPQDITMAEWKYAPRADLSGQWADGMTPGVLAELVGWEMESATEWADSIEELCDTYDEGFDRGVTAMVTEGAQPVWSAPSQALQRYFEAQALRFHH